MDHLLIGKHEATAQWYCARTQPKHEHIAANHVVKRLGLDVFNPRLNVERATRRGVVRVIEPLFPCYVFIRCVLEQHVDSIRYVSGVSSLVRFGQRVPTVPDEVIEELRQCFDSAEPMMVEDCLQAGMEVTVAQGSFLGSRGVVVRVLPARRRVQILLDFLGRATLAEFDRWALTVEDRCVARLMPRLVPENVAGIAAAA